MVTLEFIPEMKEQKLPERPQIQSFIRQFFKNNIIINDWLTETTERIQTNFSSEILRVPK